MWEEEFIRLVLPMYLFAMAKMRNRLKTAPTRCLALVRELSNTSGYQAVILSLEAKKGLLSFKHVLGNGQHYSRAI